MKKFTKLFCFCFMLMSFGVLTASAATKWTYSNYSVALGGYVVKGPLSASNNYANIEMTIDGLTYGTSGKTVFQTIFVNGSSETIKTTKTYSITKSTCVLKGLGYVGKGTWKIRNNAYTSNASYVGWNGKLIVFSATSSL